MHNSDNINKRRAGNKKNKSAKVLSTSLIAMLFFKTSSFSLCFSKTTFVQMVQCQSSSQRRTASQDAHTNKGKDHAKASVMRKLETLAEKLQRNRSHDTSRYSKHGTIKVFADGDILRASNFEDGRGDTSTERLRSTAEKRSPEHCFGTVVDGEVEGQSKDKAVGDVVNEQGQEDGEAELGVCVVSSEGNEAFREFVESNGDGSLKADRCENVGRNMVMMMLLLSTLLLGAR